MFAEVSQDKHVAAAWKTWSSGVKKPQLLDYNISKPLWHPYHIGPVKARPFADCMDPKWYQYLKTKYGGKGKGVQCAKSPQTLETWKLGWSWVWHAASSGSMGMPNPVLKTKLSWNTSKENCGNMSKPWLPAASLLDTCAQSQSVKKCRLDLLPVMVRNYTR